MEPRDDRGMTGGYNWPEGEEPRGSVEDPSFGPHGQKIDRHILRAAVAAGKPYVIRDAEGSYIDIAGDNPDAETIRHSLGIYDPVGMVEAPEPEPEPEPEVADLHPEIQADRPENDWENPVFVTRSQARKARAREAEGVLMELPYTGGFARVRILELADKASLAWVPNHLREKLAKLMDLVNDPARKAGAQRSAREAFDRVISQAEDLEELANAFCVRGFVRPRLVATEADLPPDDEEVLLVTDLHINERIAYLNGCMPASQDARILDPFRRQSPSDAPHKQGHAAAAKAKRVVGIR